VIFDKMQGGPAQFIAESHSAVESWKNLSLPNLSILVKDRDDQRAAEAQKSAAARAREVEARDARRLVLSRLREGLGPLSSAVIDHIDEFDEHRDKSIAIDCAKARASHRSISSIRLSRTSLN
jgi:hypothetical protein